MVLSAPGIGTESSSRRQGSAFAHRLALRRYRLLISESTVPSLWPRAPTSPSRDLRRGGFTGAHAEGESNSNYESRGLDYDIKGQEKRDFGT